MAANFVDARCYRWSVILVGVLALIAGTGVKKARQPPRNVVIVTIDTVRADVLPAYGGVNVETPALDRLAREGVVFEQATSTAPLTLPSHCSLFTGLLPPHHGVRDNVDSPLGDANVTLAEVLHASGRRSAAFVGSAVVGARRGLAQGFDTYSDGQRGPSNGRLRRPANVVVDEAIEWLTQRADRPFAVWVHLYDAHAPYSLPEPYRTMYEDVPYLGAIAFMDAQLARLLNVLERGGLMDRTVIVVAADHGESLGEHGEDGHGMLVYQSTLRVPLLMRMPGVSPRRVNDLVRLVDVMPTVLGALGLATPHLDGVSLLPLMSGEVVHVELEAYSESLYPRRFGWSELRALRDGRFKYISGPRPELFDLANDPSERRNVYEERRSLAAAMAARLSTLGASNTEDADRSSELDRESVERLSSLGYVATAQTPDAHDLRHGLPNPEDCISVYNAIVRHGAARARAEVSSAFSLQPPVFEPRVSPCVVEPLVSSLLGASPDGLASVRRTARTPHAANR